MSSNARRIVESLVADGKTKTEIGREIGYSRAAVSRWLSEPDYNAVHIEAAVIDRYSRVDCPHLKSELSVAQCSAYALATCPTSNARDVRHWKACQSCPHKPTTGVKS
jgi:hypothetical protein